MKNTTFFSDILGRIKWRKLKQTDFHGFANTRYFSSIDNHLFLWSVAMMWNNSISHIAWSRFMTVNVIFVFMLSNSKLFFKPARICSGYQSANDWIIHCFTQPLTERSSGYNKWVVFFETFISRMFVAVYKDVASFVICPWKTIRINKAGNFWSNPWQHWQTHLSSKNTSHWNLNRRKMENLQALYFLLFSHHELVAWAGISHLTLPQILRLSIACHLSQQFLH